MARSLEEKKNSNQVILYLLDIYFNISYDKSEAESPFSPSDFINALI